MKYLYIFLLFLIASCSQTTGSGKQIFFYDCNIILNDLRINGTKSKYYQNIDYNSILYIDKASLKTFEAIEPDFINHHGINSDIFCKVPDKYIKWYPVKLSTLEEFFSIPEKWKSVMKDFSQEFRDSIDKAELSDKIYIKNHRIAAFTLSCGTYSETYRATLINNKIRIEWLYTIME